MKSACVYQIGSGLESLRKQAYKKFGKSVLAEDGGEGKSTLLQPECAGPAGGEWTHWGQAGGASMAHKKKPFFQNVM